MSHSDAALRSSTDKTLHVIFNDVASLKALPHSIRGPVSGKD
jgi:hypothetical protein